ALVLAKLSDYGWSDNDVLANFVVVMIANEKSREDIIAELNDFLPGQQGQEFVEWLSETIDSMPDQGEAPQQNHDQDVDLPSSLDLKEQEPAAEIEPSYTDRQRFSNNSSDARAPGRLLQSAISGATRADNNSSPAAPSLRQAPSRVYESERHNDRRTPRDRSTSPGRSREQGLTTSRNKDDRVLFRRTIEERYADENRMESRLGNGKKESRGDKDRLRGRLGGRIEDRLGRRDDNRPSARSRERSWDNNNDYHDRRGGKNQRNGRNRSGDRVDLEALRNIERRLGSRPSGHRDNEESIATNTSESWSRSSERTQSANNNVIRCRFWPNCAQGDTCQYWHPRELCADFPNCPKTSDTCLFVHPLAEPTAEQVAAAARQALMQSMRNNANNKSSNGSGEGDTSSPVLNALQMPFALGSHPSMQDCKFGARCTRADCKFRHPHRDANSQQQQQQQQQQQCKFFPHCTKPNCPFFHPADGGQFTESTMGETVNTADSESSVNRLPTPCRFGDQCTRPGCHFTHPRDGAASTAMPLCKFNPCTRTGCPFRHVPGLTANKSLVLNKNTSERFAGNIVDDSEVEKLYVPASSHWASGGVSHQPNQQQQQEQGLDEAAIQAAEAQAMDMDMDIAI
ncbi:hypothetical protein BGZ49_004374, partial [Haplosporangium sp. Z 27]